MLVFHPTTAKSRGDVVGEGREANETASDSSGLGRSGRQPCAFPLHEMFQAAAG